MASASVIKENFSCFKSCVQGSFSQNDPRFGDSAGMQCACNTLAKIRKGVWTQAGGTFSRNAPFWILF